MALICSISKDFAENPVLSPYGYIYERRLVEKHISLTGKDPEADQPLTVEQLIDIKVSPVARPRPANATSIPALCKLLLDEWDAVMLAYFTEKKQHLITKQELSHTLYQHDSASRVIARLQKEVTAAREALATLKPQTVSGVSAPVVAGPQAHVPTEVTMEVEEQPSTTTGFTEEILQKLQDNSAQLTAERKKRGKTLPEGLATPEEIQKYKQTASHVAIHSASTPGILAVDICLSDTSKIVTGGKDKNAVVFDKSTESVVAILEGHSKKVTNVVYHPTENLVFTGSQDQTVRVWGVERSSPCAHVIRAHSGPVTGLSLHATGDYLLSCGLDGHWAFSDVRNGSVLLDVGDQSNNQALTCAQFHPDGLIFGTGTDDGNIRIWDLKEKTNVANFSGHQGAITSLAFSENGYHLATSAEENVVKLWDLRKLKNFKNITLGDDHKVSSLKFDRSGTYLAIGGSDVRVYLSRQWSELAVFNDHTSITTGVCFGHLASFLTSVSMDRSLKIFSL